MLYNTSLGHDLPFHMELLLARRARSDMSMSCAARTQVEQAARKQPVTRPQYEIIRLTNNIQAHATSNFLPNGIHVMYKTPSSKLLYPAVITNIFQDSQSYIITLDGTTYRCEMFYLKPYKSYKLLISQGT